MLASRSRSYGLDRASEQSEPAGKRRAEESSSAIAVRRARVAASAGADLVELATGRAGPGGEDLAAAAMSVAGPTRALSDLCSNSAGVEHTGLRAACGELLDVAAEVALSGASSSVRRPG